MSLIAASSLISKRLPATAASRFGRDGPKLSAETAARSCAPAGRRIADGAGQWRGAGGRELLDGGDLGGEAGAQVVGFAGDAHERAGGLLAGENLGRRSIGWEVSMMYVAVTCSLCAVIASPDQGEPDGHLPGAAVSPREVGDEPKADVRSSALRVVVERVPGVRRGPGRARPPARSRDGRRLDSTGRNSRPGAGRPARARRRRAGRRSRGSRRRDRAGPRPGWSAPPRDGARAARGRASAASARSTSPDAPGAVDAGVGAGRARPMGSPFTVSVAPEDQSGTRRCSGIRRPSSGHGERDLSSHG